MKTFLEIAVAVTVVFVAAVLGLIAFISHKLRD